MGNHFGQSKNKSTISLTDFDLFAEFLLLSEKAKNQPKYFFILMNLIQFIHQLPMDYHILI